MHAVFFWGVLGSACLIAMSVIAYAATHESPDPWLVDPLNLPANTFSDEPLIYLLMIFLMLGAAGMCLLGFNMDGEIGSEFVSGGLWLFLVFFGVLMCVRHSHSALHGFPRSRGNRAHWKAYHRDDGFR